MADEVTTTPDAQEEVTPEATAPEVDSLAILADALAQIDAHPMAVAIRPMADDLLTQLTLRDAPESEESKDAKVLAEVVANLKRLSPKTADFLFLEGLVGETFVDWANLAQSLAPTFDASIGNALAGAVRNLLAGTAMFEGVESVFDAFATAWEVGQKGKGSKGSAGSGTGGKTRSQFPDCTWTVVVKRADTGEVITRDSKGNLNSLRHYTRADNSKAGVVFGTRGTDSFVALTDAIAKVMSGEVAQARPEGVPVIVERVVA